MIKKGGTYVVMGLLNTDSIAYATGKMIEEQGGKVIYTVQNERLMRPRLGDDEKVLSVLKQEARR